MNTKRFNTFLKRWMQFRVDAIPVYHLSIYLYLFSIASY